tara:strand:- start:14546 stop:15307 length:762 start_codon:yes stop_codon:yes gene_type:complete
MDGTTEPVVAVIGHPIAGNPSQFAIERALLSMDLPWRVMSFDVQPEQVATALNGLETLAFRGVLIDESLADPATRWYSDRDPSNAPSTPLGCLYRSPDDFTNFCGDSPTSSWLKERIEKHFSDRGKAIENAIWLGTKDPLFPPGVVTFSAESSRRKVSNPEAVAACDLVVISDRDGKPIHLGVADWPRNDASTLVIDLTQGHPDQAQIAELGYSLISADAIRVGTIRQAMQDWTGDVPPDDVLQEAIEEYLAV